MREPPATQRPQQDEDERLTQTIENLKPKPRP
jgi:hypothetical protein